MKGTWIRSWRALATVALVAGMAGMMGADGCRSGGASLPVAETGQFLITYELESSERVSRTEFDFTYRATITNTGADAQAVEATVVSTSSATLVVDDSLTFGDVPAGASVVSADTFTIRQDRTVPFQPSALEFVIPEETCTAEAACSEIGASCPGVDVDPMDPCTVCTCVETECGGQCECETVPQCLALEPSLFPDGCGTGIDCPAEAIEYIRNPATRPSDPCARSAEQSECAIREGKHPACYWTTEYPCFRGLESRECLEYSNGDPFLSLGTQALLCSNSPGCEEQEGCECLSEEASDQNCQDVFDAWWAKGCPYDINQEEIEDPSLCTRNNVPNFKDDFTCSPYAFCDVASNYCRMYPGFPESKLLDVVECCDALTPYEGTDCAADPAACCEICSNRASCAVSDDLYVPDDFYICSAASGGFDLACEFVVE